MGQTATATMLQVFSGDAARDIARDAGGLPGDSLAMREALVEGPVRGDAWTGDAWLGLRAAHLAAAYGADDAREALVALREQLAPAREELVLWFDDDLFCQVHMLYLLASHEAGAAGGARVSVVAQGSHLTGGEDPRELFDARIAVDEATQRLAGRAWTAYVAPDPRSLAQLVASPAATGGGVLVQNLVSALRLHLERLPAVGDGLGRVERSLLALVAAQDEVTFRELFNSWQRAEPGFGFGDTQVWNVLCELASPGVGGALLATADDDELRPGAVQPDTAFIAGVQLDDVLGGRLDARTLGMPDRWVGGVCVVGADTWRFDPARGQVVPPVGS